MTFSGGDGDDSPAKGRSFVLVLAAVLALSLSLRIPTIALGPLLAEIGSSTGHGETFLSLLTTIPLAITLIMAPLSPGLARRIGRDRIVAIALLGIVVGTLVRSIPGDAGLLAGTTLLGLAIAVGTVLVPGVIAAERPRRRALLTSVYSMALSLGPALALGLTVPIMDATGLGWRGTLATWATCAAVALALWLLHAGSATTADDAAGRAGKGPAGGTSREAPPVAADARVWLLAAYLGITSLTFYTTSTWLPTTLGMDGMEARAAGGVTSLVNIVAIPFGLLAPMAVRRKYGWLLAPLAPVVAVGGVVLLLATGAAGALPMALLLGASQGLCLGVSYDQVVRYARSSDHATAVSALTSAVGIAFAAVGPFAFGFGLETARSWLLPVCGLGLVLVVQSLIGFRTGGLGRAGA